MEHPLDIFEHTLRHTPGIVTWNADGVHEALHDFDSLFDTNFVTSHRQRRAIKHRAATTEWYLHTVNACLLHELAKEGIIVPPL